VLHHFNDPSTCGTWCKHRGKRESELAKLKKYRKKDINNQLYLLIFDIIERFSDEDRLRECHHKMHSQKNEAMNKSIMTGRYVRQGYLPPESMLRFGIDTLGRVSFFEEIFCSIGFTATGVTFSGLRHMRKKKEYGRIYSGIWKVKRRRRMIQRDLMIEGMNKMDVDAKEGQGYSSGIHMQEESKDEESEERKRKKKKARTEKQNNNPLTHHITWGLPDV
jgi:hypothetical protein